MAAIAAAVFGLSYASVPLYKVFCSVRAYLICFAVCVGAYQIDVVCR